MEIPLNRPQIVSVSFNTSWELADLSANFDFDPKNCVWLKCDRQHGGRTLVRRGKRLDLPESNEKEPKWVFCPMKESAMKKGLISYNRDRVLTSECEKCPYFGGYQEHQAESLYKCTFPIFRVTREMIEQAIQMAIEEEKQWRSLEEHD